MKHIPQRTCIVCRAQGEKENFVRVVRRPDGTFAIDESGKAAGRGAYVCKNAKCAELAAKKRSLNKAFKVQVDQSVYDALRDAVGRGE